MRLPSSAVLACLLLTAPIATRGGEDRPIPIDPARQERYARELLDWSRQTLGGAYEKVGKKDPRWDEPAREALEAAARWFGRAVDPCGRPEHVFHPAKRAVDAGCDDPLILHLHARCATGPNSPGPVEDARRGVAAALAMERSAYPPLRRASAMIRTGQVLASKPGATAAERKEAARLLDATLALVVKEAVKGAREFEGKDRWYSIVAEVFEGQRLLIADPLKALAHCDAVLAKAPALEVIRLQLRASFYTDHAWKARGIGLGDTVTPEAARLMEKRLAVARKALERAWTLDPSGKYTPNLMLGVLIGVGGDRDVMETWFRRAIEVDGNGYDACYLKMDYLDPKWYGSQKEVLAFAKACRNTKDWRSGTTLLSAEVHYRVALQLGDRGFDDYMGNREVWDDVRPVYEEYLGHYEVDHQHRSMFAALSQECGSFMEADRQFKILGDNLIGNDLISLATMKELRDDAAE